MAINEEFREKMCFANIHRFFRALRKAGVFLDIVISERGVDYQLKENTPINFEDWEITLKGMIDEKEITEKEAASFRELLISLYHYV